MMIELKTRDVEQIFATRFAIGPNGRTALRGRLEHLRRLGTPRGVQQGQGRAAKFGWGELLPLAVAVELLNVGLTPDHAHRVVSDGHAELIQSFSMLAVDMGAALIGAVESGELPAGMMADLLITSDAFSALRSDGIPAAPSILPSPLSAERFDLTSELSTSRVTIDLASLTVNHMRAMSRGLDRSKAEIVESYQQWAVQNVHNP